MISAHKALAIIEAESGEFRRMLESDYVRGALYAFKFCKGVIQRLHGENKHNNEMVYWTWDHKRMRGQITCAIRLFEAGSKREGLKILHRVLEKGNHVKLAA